MGRSGTRLFFVSDLPDVSTPIDTRFSERNIAPIPRQGKGMVSTLPSRRHFDLRRRVHSNVTPRRVGDASHVMYGHRSYAHDVSPSVGIEHRFGTTKLDAPQTTRAATKKLRDFATT